MTERLKKKEDPADFFMACDEDFLLNENHEFRDFLLKTKWILHTKKATGNS